MGFGGMVRAGGEGIYECERDGMRDFHFLFPVNIDHFSVCLCVHFLFSGYFPCSPGSIFKV